MEDSCMSDENKVDPAVEAENTQGASVNEAAEPQPDQPKEAVESSAAEEKPVKAEEASAVETDQPAARPESGESAAEEAKPAEAAAVSTETSSAPEPGRRRTGSSGESEGQTEQRDDRRGGRSYDRGGGDSRYRRPGGGRGRYRSFYRRKYCKFCSKKIEVSYRDPDTLRRFITDRGKILPRRITGTCPKHQRKLSVAIKQARILALLPFVEK
jgi:small subunit ribosomal protein S18